MPEAQLDLQSQKIMEHVAKCLTWGVRQGKADEASRALSEVLDELGYSKNEAAVILNKFLAKIQEEMPKSPAFVKGA